MSLSRSTLLVCMLNYIISRKNKKAIDLVSYCKDIVFAPHIISHPHFAPPISKFLSVYIKKKGQLHDHEVVLKDFRVHRS